MKDPSFLLLNAVYSRGVTLTDGVCGAYEFRAPDEDAQVPYESFVVLELLPAVRSGAKNQEGTDWIVQARVAVNHLDFEFTQTIGDLVTQGLIPNVIDMASDGFKIVHTTLDGIIPLGVTGSGPDKKAETLYRYRYNLQEL